MTFAELLKLARRGAGMTQEELASAARVSARSISDLERGVYPTARKETARRLAEALALDASARATFEAAARGDNVIGGSSLAALPNRGVAEATKALPRDIAAFTGRCAELETIMNSAAQNSGVAIQVIDGMAGVGKTTFAVRAAHQLAPDFPDGQIFLALHAHTPGQTTASPEDALASLLLTIGISRQQIPPGLEPRAAAWRSHTSGKRLLILLDDVSGHDQVRSLFPGTGKHLVLITSRRRLTALEDCGTISLETLPDPEAIELFIRLCGRPELGTQNTAVAELVRFCGGLPLAVGLLARQLYHHRIWTAEDLSRDLRDARNRLDLIHAENLSVAAALDLSYQDLEPDEQVFFRLLGQQPGTDIDPYAAAALAHTDVPTARRCLLSLYDHHLVTEPAHDRFRLHDLVRQHARMLTSEPAAKAEAARGLLRLLDYYLHVARSASALLTRRPASHITEATGDPPAFAPQLRTRTDAVRWLTAERLSLQACAEWAAVNGQLNYVIATSAAMHDFLHSSGHWDQAVSLHTAAVAAAHAADSRLAEADALTNLGDIQHMVMDMPSAEENLARAIELYRETRNRRGEANAILLLGIIQRLTDYRRATTSLTVALSLYQEDGDRLGQANVLHELGLAQAVTEGSDAAAATLKQALSLHRELDDRVGEAKDLSFLGVVEYLIGSYQASLASLTRSLALYREVGDRLGEAVALNYLGVTEYLLGEYATAEATLGSALRLFRELGGRLGEANTINYLGVLHRLGGNYQLAAADHDRALEIYREISNPLGEAYALNFIGVVHLSTGMREDAEAYLISALRLTERVGDRFAAADVLNNLGELARTSGDLDAARARFEQALALARDIRSPLRQATALEGLGLCDADEERDLKAQTNLREALGIHTKLGSPHVSRVAAILEDHSW